MSYMSYEIKSGAPTEDLNETKKTDMEVEDNDDVGGLDDDGDDELITMIGKDGTVTITKREMTLSKMMKTAMEKDKEERTFDFSSTLSKNTLEFIAVFLKHQQGEPCFEIPPPLKSSDLLEAYTQVAKEQGVNDIDMWAPEWVLDIWRKDRQAIYDILLAANYLDISCLLKLCCAAVASKIRGKPESEIANAIDPSKSGSEETAK